jgi:hypothetical protein
LVCFDVGHLSFTGIVVPSGHFLVVDDGGLLLMLPFVPLGVTILATVPLFCCLAAIPAW